MGRQDGTRPVGLRRVFCCFCGPQRRGGKRAQCQHRRQMRAEMEFLRTTGNNSNGSWFYRALSAALKHNRLAVFVCDLESRILAKNRGQGRIALSDDHVGSSQIGVGRP